MTDQEEQQLMVDVMNEIGARLNQAKTNDDAAAIASTYALIGYKMMRATGGKEFTLGWLGSAIEDVNTTEPELTWVPMQ